MSFVFEKINKNEVKIVSYKGKEENLIIPSFAFFDKRVLRVTYIDKYALNNSSIKKLFIPKTIKFIHELAFLGFNKLNIEEIIVASNNENYSSFEGNLYSKDRKVFIRYASSSLKEKFVMPSSVEIIENSAFDNSSYLKSVVLNKNLQIIKAYAFAFCANLKKITLPDTLLEIGDFVFLNHEQLNSIKLPSSLKTLGDGIFRSIRNPNINISISSKNKNFRIYKGGLYSYNKEVLYKYLALSDEVYLSRKLIEIKPYAFCYLYLDEVNIPSNVKIVGKGAFKGSTIRKITLSDNIKVLSKSLFEFCKFLNEVKLPASLIEIESLAFATCSSLEVLDLPDSLTKLGDSVFASTKIKKLKINENVILSEDTFKGCSFKLK